MKKYMKICLLSIFPLMVHGMNASEKNNRGSDKSRKALYSSQQIPVVQNQEGKSRLSHSAPIAIPKKNNPYLLDIPSNPKNEDQKLSFGDYFQSYQGCSPSPDSCGSKR